MTDQELHKVFEERLPSMKSHIDYYSEGKEDLKQEGLLGMWRSLKKDPTCKDRFIKNNIRWSMIQFARKGKSVDSDIKSFKRRQRDIEIIRTDALAEEVKEYIFKDNRSSAGVEDVAIGRICYSRFIRSLSALEKRFVLSKLREELREKLYKELGQYKFMATYCACREKFRAKFEC